MQRPKLMNGHEGIDLRFTLEEISCVWYGKTKKFKLNKKLKLKLK